MHILLFISLQDMFFLSPGTPTPTSDLLPPVRRQRILLQTGRGFSAFSSQADPSLLMTTQPRKSLHQPVLHHHATTAAGRRTCRRSAAAAGTSVHTVTRAELEAASEHVRISPCGLIRKLLLHTRRLTPGDCFQQPGS